MGVGNLTPDDDSTDDGGDNGESKQSKTLVANCYSTENDDNYKDVSDWTHFDPVAYDALSQGGSLRGWLKNSLVDATEFTNYEEYISQIMVGLAHATGAHEFEQYGREASGTMNELLDVLMINGDDIVQYHFAEKDTMPASGGLDAENLVTVVEEDDGLREEFFARLDSLDGVEIDESHLPSE